jgi:hypothetical protein
MESFGDFFCNIQTRIAFLMPPMPQHLVLGTLATQLGASLPFLGSQLIYELLSDITDVLSLAIGYKILKIIPAKF